jgi:3-hydroxyisobutyrate dehydrogenase
MGRSMAAHLQQAGYPLIVYNRTRNKAESLLNAGATWAATPAEVARQAQVIFAIVGFPHDVESVFLGEDGVVPNGQSGSIFCDCTTSSPTLAVRIAEAGRQKDIAVLDAPVSGGDVGAKNGTLSIMCGGPKEAFDRLKPLLDLMGKNVVYQGAAGSGQHTKMCNQIAIAGGMTSICEALLYAEASGLDSETVLKSISSGAAGSWSLSNLAPRILKGNFEPGFYVEHFIKDMDIALQEAERMGLKTPALQTARDLYEQVRAMGGGRKGTQALYWAYSGRKGEG